MSEPADGGDDGQLQQALLGYVLRSPVGFSEFLFPDMTESRGDQQALDTYTWSANNYTHVAWSQYPLLLEPVGSYACGRTVGKSALGIRRRNMQTALTYANAKVAVVMNQENYVRQLHLNPTTEMVEKHPLLRAMVDRISKEDREIVLRNGAVLRFLSPGAQPSKSNPASAAQGVQSQRTTSLVFDEAQNCGSELVNETEQTMGGVDPLNPDDQRLRGASYRFFGVPDGRQDTPFARNESEYRTTVVGPDGIEVDVNRTWKLASPGMSYFTSSLHRRLLRRYQCVPEQGIWTDKYKRDVWGLSTQSALRLFPDELRAPISHHLDSWRHVQTGYLEWRENSRVDEYNRWISTDWGYLLAKLPQPASSVYGFGVDPGGRDRTSICIWYEEPESKGVWTWQANVSLVAWGGDHSFEQCTVLDFLRQYYRPRFIGSDATGWGSAFLTPLRSDQRFAREYESLLHEYHYGNVVTVAYYVDESALARATSEAERRRLRENPKPVTDQVQPYTMDQIGQCFRQARYRLPSAEQAPEIHGQLGSITCTYVTSSTGKSSRRFFPEHPHYVSGLQMFTMARAEDELDQERQNARPRAAAEGWQEMVHATVTGPPLFGDL